MNLKKEIKKVLTAYLQEHIDEFSATDVHDMAVNAVYEWDRQ